MDNVGELLRPERIIIRAERAIGKTLEEVGLIEYLPKEPGQKSIAILGAGVVVEAGSLRDYFVHHGLGAPKITAYDNSWSSKRLTEELFPSKTLGLEYHTGDITEPESFKNERYDIVLIRKPDVHNSTDTWEKAFRNGFKHLKHGGVFLATTDLYSDFVLAQLRRGGEVVKNYTIPEIDRVGPFFNESDLFIAKKKDL